MKVMLLYESRSGASCAEYRMSVDGLYARLSRLRKNGVKWAEAWEMNGEDRVEVIGGIEEIEGADDQRIRYQIWADETDATVTNTCKPV